MRPWECPQTDTHTHTRTDAKRFYYLSQAICYSYGADNNIQLSGTIYTHQLKSWIRSKWLSKPVQWLDSSGCDSVSNDPAHEPVQPTLLHYCIQPSSFLSSLPSHQPHLCPSHLLQLHHHLLPSPLQHCCHRKLPLCGLSLPNPDIKATHNNIIATRKHRQSYWHADPREQQHTAVEARVTSNCVTVTVFITVWPWPSDLWVNACRTTAIKYTCTKFGVDSSSRFPFRVQTLQVWVFALLWVLAFAY